MVNDDFEFSRNYNTRYMDFINRSTDASRNFSELLSYQVLGHALGWECVHSIQPDALRHNMYILLVGDSTVTRKSTSQRLARFIYALKDRKISLPEETSPEQFLTLLSENPSRVSYMGEFSQLLKQISTGGYNTTMVEILNNLYDCPPDGYERSLRKKKGQESDFKIPKPNLSANSTITPSMLKQYATDEMVYGGFLARWLLVFGVISTIRPRSRLEVKVRFIRDTVCNDLELITTLGCAGATFSLTDEGLDEYNRIYNEIMSDSASAGAFCGRYSDYILKIADTMLISDILIVNDCPALPRIKERISTMMDLGQLLALAYETSLKSETVAKALTDLLTIKTEHYTSAESMISGRAIDAQMNFFTNKPKDGKAYIIVPTAYVKKAWELIKPCLAFAKSIADFVSYDKPIAKLLDTLNMHAPLDRSSLMQLTHLSRRDMDMAVDTLFDNGLLIPIAMKVTGPRTNVLKMVYCLRGNLNTQSCLKCMYHNPCWSVHVANIQANIEAGVGTK